MPLSLEDRYSEFLSQVNWEIIFQRLELEPQNKGDYLEILCPKCEERRAFFYPNTDSGNPKIICNRRDECGFENHILEYMNNGIFPSGEDWKESVKKLASLAGIPFELDETYKPATPRKHLLNEYWELLKSRFEDSKAEEYARFRGLDPDKNEFGLFPDTANEVMAWAKESGWTTEDLESAKLIKKKEGGGYYVFAWARLAGAFKDCRGNVFNIWGRDLTGEDNPKYLNLNNSIYAHKDSPYEVGPRSNTDIWIEGYLDACALAECGFRALGTGTNSISDAMWETTYKGKTSPHKRALIALDADGAGRDGALRFLQKHLNDKNPSIWFTNPAQMRECKDFAELYQTHGVEAVKMALEESTWIHRDQALAALLVEQNSGNKNALTDVECEAICLKAYEIDKRLSSDRCPSFEKHFWRPLCESIGYDIDAVIGTVENKRERQRNEQILKRVNSQHDAAREALSKRDMTSYKGLQKSIAGEIQSLENQSDAVHMFTQTYTREDLKAELATTAQGIKTGLIVDKEEVELATEGVTTLALPTSHGKTTIACCMTINALNIQKDLEIVYVSFEESAAKITSRLAHRYIDIELSKDSLKTLQNWYATGSTKFFKNQTLPDGFLEKEGEFWNLIESKRLTILAPENKSLDNLLTIAKTAVERYPNCKLIVVDYLQLIELPDRSRDPRHDQLKQICDELMQFGRNNGIAILCPAQFNRTVKEEKEVILTAIGEAGSIERFSDQVIGGWNRTFNEQPGTLIKIKILKSRYGRRRDGLLNWDGNLGKVEEGTFNEIKNKTSVPEHNY